MSQDKPTNISHDPENRNPYPNAKSDEPIFHYDDESSAPRALRARTIAIAIALFVSAIAVTQFGQASRARQTEFLRGSAKIDALGKTPPHSAASGGPASSTEPTSRNADVRERTPAVYASHKYGLALQYPRTYVLRRGQNANLNLSGQPAVPSTFTQPGGVSLATISIPATLYPGSDFKSASLTVRVNRQVSSDACPQFRNPEDESATLQPSKVTVGAIDFDEADYDVSDDAADAVRSSQERYYHVYENDACYEFALNLTTTKRPAKTSRVNVDADEVFDRLSEVLTSVTVVPLRNPAVAASTQSE
jgi:hypothetical protein